MMPVDRRSKFLQHARGAFIGALLCLLATSYFMDNASTTREMFKRALLELSPTAPPPSAPSAPPTVVSRSWSFDDLLLVTKRRIAVTVLFGNGNRKTGNSSTGGLIDGACVLRQTMLEFQPLDVELDFIGLVRSEADVHPLVLTTLKAYCGFTFRVSNTTVDPMTIGDATLREAIRKDTVGALELLKLHSLLMVEYELVLCLDADVMFVGPYDDLLVPYDDIPYRQTPDCNGGIVVYFPRNNGSAHAAAILKAFVVTPYSPQRGYANYTYGAVMNANMGLSGGPLLQGLLPFYMTAHLLRNPRHPDIAIERCRHNYFVALSHFKVCEHVELNGIRSVHFKGGDGTFPKPWDCAGLKRGCERPNCKYFRERFLEEHKKLLQRLLSARAIAATATSTSDSTPLAISATEAAGAGDAVKPGTKQRVPQLVSGCVKDVFFGVEYHLTGNLGKAATAAGAAVGNVKRAGVKSSTDDDGSALKDLALDVPVGDRRRRRRIAVTVLFGTGNQVISEERSGDKLKNTTVGLINGACVLRQTMLKHKPANVDLEFIGLVASMGELSPFVATVLTEHCGFSFQVSNTTVSPDMIQTKALKDEVRADTVGALELLKLHSLLMVEYELVLCLDADVMFVGPYDDLLVPYDDIPYRQTPDCNGGIVVYFPRNNGSTHVAAILNLLVTAPYSRQRGYQRTYFGAILDARRGLSGGPMLQGLLPFYILTHFNRNPRDLSMAITPCRHNYYVAPEHFKVCEGAKGIRSVHFKGGDGFFPKPWDCASVASSCTRPSCRHFQQAFAKEHLALMQGMPNYKANKALVGCGVDHVFRGIESIVGDRVNKKIT